MYHSGLFVVSKDQGTSRSWSGMFWDVLIDVCVMILWIVELNLSETFVFHLGRLCVMVLHCIVQKRWYVHADGRYSDDV